MKGRGSISKIDGGRVILHEGDRQQADPEAGPRRFQSLEEMLEADAHGPYARPIDRPADGPRHHETKHGSVH